jgi:hypothetical protein
MVQKNQNPRILILTTIITGVMSLIIIGLGIKSTLYVIKSKVTVDSLTIGTLYKPENLTGLAEHLEKELIPSNYFDFLKGKKISVVINGDENISYDQAQQRIYNKKWDIAFTLSPVNSIFAKEQGYSYVAAMFPDSPVYEAGLIVRKDSPIQSLEDINENTVVALGGFNSASSFYMPVYELYGKRVSITMGHRGTEIRERVGSILVCSDFSKNPVDLFCPQGTTIKHIMGKVNGLSSRGNDFLLKVITSDSQIYTVSVNRQFLPEDSRLIQGKTVLINVPQTSQNNDETTIKVTLPTQIKIVD